RIENNFLQPPQSAKPWVFWYWLHGSVSKKGITADLEAMQKVGLGGAYLMFIKDTSSVKINYAPQVRQLSPAWFELVAFAMKEAERLHLQLGLHVSDGFALAGGPWITPALSMQKIVFTKQYVKGGVTAPIQLLQPETNEGYYKDISLVAFPTKSVLANANLDKNIKVTSNVSGVPSSLPYPGAKGASTFKSDSSCWIQYDYQEAYSFSSATIYSTNNYASLALEIQASNDGVNFNSIKKLITPRHGWQDTDAPYTFSLPTTKARYIRFVYDKKGLQPGSESLDAAKWKPTLKIKHITLSDEPVVDNYEAKNGSVWRIAAANTDTASLKILQQKEGINLTGKIDAKGELHVTLPPGNWMLVRIGATSTGHKNETAGGGKGLECDKFNPAAVTLQFNKWFERLYQGVDAANAKDVVKIFHVDSWECGSQNWSDVFLAAFKQKRGYDLLPYLPVMAGIPIESFQKTESVLYDIRTTIAELINDNFFGTLKNLVQQKGILFSAESVAPTMLSDGMLHYKNVDMPMGEFWNNSPTHDKPNDVLDAISGAHIYGKNIIQAEAFTTLRMDWKEHPGNLKMLGDQNFALGINKLAIHVFMHNPFTDRVPGVTLDPIGLYFQRNQTWFNQSKAWIQYLARTQSLLQLGKPVADIAVFSGDELPSRASLPSVLTQTLPGLFEPEKIEAQKLRLQNTGQPMRQEPVGVSFTANTYQAKDWINPLRGYLYDSFNADALEQLRYTNGALQTPSGSRYKILVIAADTLMNPSMHIRPVLVQHIMRLVAEGATVIVDKAYASHFTNAFSKAGIAWKTEVHVSNPQAIYGKGKLIQGPIQQSDFTELGTNPDVTVVNKTAVKASHISFTHRVYGNTHIYFVSNQSGKNIQPQLLFRQSGVPIILDPVTVKSQIPAYAKTNSAQNVVELNLAANESKFIVFTEAPEKSIVQKAPASISNTQPTLFDKQWKIYFDSSLGGPSLPLKTETLSDISKNENPAVKYYSGSMRYQNTFRVNDVTKTSIGFAEIHDIATVFVNGIDCGTIWTPPYVLDISKAVRKGNNSIEIVVSNTWHNRLLGDAAKPNSERVTYTTYPFDFSKNKLQPAGIIGEVKINQVAQQ
ncbi:MAG: hypothetical protein RL372_293, partial [Bacteroidota bacterium]